MMLFTIIIIIIIIRTIHLVVVNKQTTGLSVEEWVETRQMKVQPRIVLVIMP